jgi:hypothetical protein
VTITDEIPANTTYSATSLGCTSGTKEWYDSVDAQWESGTEPTAANVSDVRCFEGTATASGGTITMTFDVEIN